MSDNEKISSGDRLNPTRQLKSYIKQACNHYSTLVLDLNLAMILKSIFIVTNMSCFAHAHAWWKSAYDKKWPSYHTEAWWRILYVSKNGEMTLRRMPGKLSDD